VAGRVSLDEAIQPWNREGLFVLPAGSTPPNPGGLLGSNSVRDLLVQLRRDYDYVIIDAPPLVPVTDAAVVAHLADGALVVARYGRTTRQQLVSSTASLAAAQARLLGVVFNRVAPPKPWSRRSDYEYYATEHATDREPARP
jgi:capsular exopolysaccharide synthesis family protein